MAQDQVQGLTQDQVQAITSAVAQIQNQVGSNSTLVALLETNPYQALVNYGAPITNWPPDVVNNFNFGLVSNNPMNLLISQKRSGGPDSLQCWCCYIGVYAAMMAAVVAIGAAISSAFPLLIPVLAKAAVDACGAAIAVVTAGAGTVGSVSLGTGIQLLAKYICNSIPNTCQPPPPSPGLGV